MTIVTLPLAILDALPPHPDDLPKPTPSPRRAPNLQHKGDVSRAERKSRATYDKLLNEIASARDERHNITLSGASKLFCMAYGRDWHFTPADVERDVFNATVSSGYASKVGQAEIERLIASARAWGQAHPIDLTLPDNPPHGKRGAQSPAPDAPPADPALPAEFWPLTVGMEQAINELATAGAGIVYRALSVGHTQGIISDPEHVTFAQVRTSAAAAGVCVAAQTLRRYLTPSLEDRGVSILTPRIQNPDLGVKIDTWSMRPLQTIKDALKERKRKKLQIGLFPARERAAIDPKTGEGQIKPAVPADLPAAAFEEHGFDPAAAAEIAAAFEGQTFDKESAKLRTDARRMAEFIFGLFCAQLENSQRIALPEEMTISKEADLKRAQLRAWHAAKLPYFETIPQQCRALGVAKNTLKKYLADVGIEVEETLIPLELSAGDVGEQVRKGAKELKAFPKTYVSIDPDTGVIDRALYNRVEVEKRLASGQVVSIEFQAANRHHIGDLPPREDSPRRRVRRTSEPKIGLPTPPRPARHAEIYPKAWVFGQVQLRYKLVYGKAAPLGLPLRELVDRVIVGLKKPQTPPIKAVPVVPKTPPPPLLPPDHAAVINASLAARRAAGQPLNPFAGRG